MADEKEQTIEGQNTDQKPLSTEERLAKLESELNQVKAENATLKGTIIGEASKAKPL
jgi:hypothetical protein